jgi:hypothetical protein
MNKIIWTLGLLLIIAFSIMQLFRPEPNRATVTQNDIVFQLEMPPLVKKTIINACYDCHSTQTRYPWYASISPFFWMIDSHIRAAKAKLNFSDWGGYSTSEQIDLLKEINEEIREKDMPLNSYVLFHKKADLFDHEIEELCRWALDTADSLR